MQNSQLRCVSSVNAVSENSRLHLLHGINRMFCTDWHSYKVLHNAARFLLSINCAAAITSSLNSYIVNH
jgi:hypothetical protein